MRNKSMEVALLAISLLMLGGCNEKISAELNSGSTVVLPPTVTPPTSFSFKVTEISNPNLGYSLHKTGLGNKNTACEVTKPTAFTNDDYLGNQSTYDITCFMEAEELALYNSGMNFKVEASPGACEFVGYRPYSFFSKMPGDSTASFRVVTCGTGVGDAQAAGYGASYGTGGDVGLCDEYVDIGSSVPVANKLPVRVDIEEELCRYNYDTNQCDIGVITVNEVNITKVGTLYEPTYSTRKITCGGKVRNCVSGPITLESKLDKYTSGEMVYEVVDGSAFTTTKEYPGLIIEQRKTNIEYANYRRFLSSRVIDFWNDILEQYIPGRYITGTLADTTFDPELYRAYAFNRSMDASAYNMIDPAQVRATAGAQVGYATRPLALEPYVGLFDTAAVNPANRYDYTVHPFYTFACLDNAHEPTARVRIMVRDWDRIFDKNAAYTEYLTDYDYGMNARQDRRYYVSEDLDFNNRKDWDDILPMGRRTGVYSPAATWWRPALPLFSRGADGTLEKWNFPVEL